MAVANSGGQSLNKLRDKGRNPDRMTAKGQYVEVKVEVEVGFRVVGGEDEVEASHFRTRVGKQSGELNPMMRSTLR